MKKIILLFATVIFQAHAIETSLAAEPAKTFIFEGPSDERVEIKIPESIIDKMNFFKGFESIEGVQSLGGLDVAVGNQEAVDIPYFVIETFIKKYPGMSYESFISYLKYLIELIQSTLEDPFDQSKIDSFMNLGRIADFVGCDQSFPQYLIDQLAQIFFGPINSIALEGPAGWVKHEFSADGNYAVSLSMHRIACLFDLRKKDHIISTVLNSGTEVYYSVTFSPNGYYVLACSSDGSARVWDLRDEDHITPILLQGDVGKIVLAQFTPDSNYVVTYSNDGRARLWNLRDKDHVIPTVFDGRTDDIASVAFSPDSNYMLTESYNETVVRLWDLRDKSNITSSELRDHASLSDYETILIGYAAFVNAIAFSPDGHYALTVSDDIRVRLWDVHDTSIVLEGHVYDRRRSDIINSVVFSPDGNYAVTNTTSENVRLWDLRDKSHIISKSLKDYAKEIYEAVFSPDGNYILAKAYDEKIYLFDLRGEEPINSATLRGPARFIAQVIWSSDSNYALTTTHNDNTASLWDLRDKSNITSTVLQDHTYGISSVAFSPDSNFALTAGSREGSIRFWDLRSFINPLYSLNSIGIAFLLDFIKSSNKLFFVDENQDILGDLPKHIQEKINQIMHESVQR